MMYYRRYGKFQWKDYISGWIGLLTLLLLAIFGLWLLDQKHKWLIIFPTVYFLILSIDIVTPYLERFDFTNQDIYVKRGNNETILTIPEDATVIVSRVSIRPKHTLDTRAWLMRDKIAVNIISGLSLNDVLETLHGNPAKQYVSGFIRLGKQYTSHMIEDEFSDHFIYNFVCDQSMLENFLHQKNDNLIIPESLQSIFDYDFYKEFLCIDSGY